MLGSVVLRIALRETCRNDVHRSEADGESMHVAGISHRGERAVAFDLDLAPATAGGTSLVGRLWLGEPGAGSRPAR